MKNHKHVLSLVLALVMALSLFPLSALAADSDFIIEDGVLTYYKGSGGDVVIPDGVTAIGTGAFSGLSMSGPVINTLVIPGSVTRIGPRAFEPDAYTTSEIMFSGNSPSVIPLKSVYFAGTQEQWNAICQSMDFTSNILLWNMTVQCLGDDYDSGALPLIPEGTTSISYMQFYGRDDLTSVTIPGSVTTIDYGAFGLCENLTDVTMEEGVTYLAQSAFDDCKNLTSIVIPNTVTSIGQYAFRRTALTHVTIPGSVESIGPQAFVDSALTDLVLSDGMKTISYAAFEGAIHLDNVVIPEGVTSIERNAFSCCYALTNITIPASVTYIEKDAFHACDALTDVYYGGSEAQWNAINFWEPDTNSCLTSATIHFGADDPAEPEPTPQPEPEPTPQPEPTPGAGDTTAYPSTQTVDMDGRAVEFQCYALKDEDGNMTNYIKLRDLAILLNGSAAQFQVGWDGSVTITTQAAYTPNGSELSTPYAGNREYRETSAQTKINGQTADLAAFVLSDDAGGGYTYYQLRDLGRALGFNVGWSADRGLFLETDRPYDANN